MVANAWTALRPRFSVDANEPDRLPKRLEIHWYDLALTIICILGVLADIVTDALVATYYYENGKILHASLMLIFTVVPSLVVASISIYWYVEDSRTSSNKSTVRFLLPRILFSLFQLPIVVRYVDSLLCSIRFRKVVRQSGSPHSRPSVSAYVRLIEEERDGVLYTTAQPQCALLRLLEAFMESSPQLLLQLYMVNYEYWKENRSPAGQSVLSIIFSACSLAYSLVSHHKFVRMARQDRRNLSLVGVCVQFGWRFFTLCSRFIALVAFTLCFQYWLALLLAVRYAVVTIALQFEKSFICSQQHVVLECLFKAVVGVVHLFVPLTLKDGSTAVRYVLYYALQLSEDVVISLLPIFNDSFNFPHKESFVVLVVITFCFGIGIMQIYYWFFHPNGKRPKCASRNVKSSSSARKVQNSSSDADNTKTPIPLDAMSTVCLESQNEK